MPESFVPGDFDVPQALNPTTRPGHDAEISSWVTEPRADMDRTVWATVSEWLRTDWPFPNPHYAERSA